MYRIKEFREKKGFSQQKLAEAIGVDRGLISLYESGKKKPKISRLKRIARALNCSYLDLIGEKEPFKQWVRILFSELVSSNSINSFEYDEDTGQIVITIDSFYYDEDDEMVIEENGYSLVTNDSNFMSFYKKQLYEAKEFIIQIWDSPENKKMIIADESEWPEEGIDLSEPGEVIEFPKKNGC